jgi:hypothetical protein
MKTHYKTLPLILYLVLTAISIGFSILVFKWFTLRDYSPISIFLFCLFLFMTTLPFMAGGLEIKSMEIDNNRLIFKQLFGLFSQKCDFTEIVGFKKSIFRNKVGEYPILLIKTRSEKIYEINGFLISNTDNIEKELKKTFAYDKSIVKPMIGLKEKTMIFFLACFLISFIWFIISHI